MAQSVAVLSTLPKLPQYLRKLLPNVCVTDVLSGMDNHSDLDKAEIVVADCDLLIPYVTNNKLPSLKWVQSTWAGVDKLTPYLQEQKADFILTRFSGQSFGLAMSEYVIAQIVNFERNQRQQYENQRTAIWSQDGKIANHRLICDLNIGILGLGTIGKFIAENLKLFGAIVWGMSRTLPRETLHCLHEHRTTSSLVDILKNCDYIINVLPTTTDTAGLLNGNILENCKQRGSVFINIGRGSIIREKDLVNALKEKWLSGAILDVFENEPLPADSELWSLPEVIISPHNAGITRAIDVAKLFSDNYNKYINGKSMTNVFDWKTGY